MDDQNFKDLAMHAWALYKQTETLRQTLFTMFLDEFLAINEDEQKRYHPAEELPF